LVRLDLVAVLAADFVVQRPTIVRTVLWAYGFAAAGTALIGIQSFVAQGLAGTRATALQNQDPAQFAAVLLPAAVFGLYELLNGGRRVPGGLIAFLATAGIIVSGTRGAWVAYVVVLALFILPRLTPRRRVAAVATILVVLIGAYQIPGVAALVAERNASALSTGGAGRTDIWAVGLTIFTRAPLTGVGHGNFPFAYTPDVVAASSATHASAMVEGRGPHNLVVGTLVELGPIGLALLALLILPLVVRRGWGPEAATVQAALASLCVAALFLDIFGNRKQVWLLIGLAAGLAYLRRWSAGAAERGERPDSPVTSSGEQDRTHVAGVAAPHAAVVPSVLPKNPRRVGGTARR
jgi:O-antigen ligase